MAILELTYIVNFGSELAVVSMLPTFFETTFDLPKATAGILASCFAFVNLVARPAGGLISDSVGSRKNTMGFLTAGLGIGYLVMSMIKPGTFSGTTGIVVAVVITMLASFFVQSGEGATFALVPLVKRRVTGQVAGLVGAYGNVGAVTYLTIFSLLPMWMGGGGEPTPEVIAASNSTFFQILGVAGLIVAFFCFFFLKEPKGSFDGAARRRSGLSHPLSRSAWALPFQPGASAPGFVLAPLSPPHERRPPQRSQPMPLLRGGLWARTETTGREGPGRAARCRRQPDVDRPG